MADWRSSIRMQGNLFFFLKETCSFWLTRILKSCKSIHQIELTQPSALNVFPQKPSLMWENLTEQWQLYYSRKASLSVVYLVYYFHFNFSYCQVVSITCLEVHSQSHSAVLLIQLTKYYSRNKAYPHKLIVSFTFSTYFFFHNIYLAFLSFHVHMKHYFFIHSIILQGILL